MRRLDGLSITSGKRSAATSALPKSFSSSTGSSSSTLNFLEGVTSVADDLGVGRTLRLGVVFGVTTEASYAFLDSRRGVVGHKVVIPRLVVAHRDPQSMKNHRQKRHSFPQKTLQRLLGSGPETRFLSWTQISRIVHISVLGPFRPFTNPQNSSWSSYGDLLVWLYLSSHESAACESGAEESPLLQAHIWN